MDIKIFAAALAALMGAGIVIFSAVPASAADPEIPHDYRHVTPDHLTELVTLTDGLHDAYAQPDTSNQLQVYYADIFVSNTVTYSEGKRTIQAQAASKPFTANGVEWRAVRADTRDPAQHFAFILNSAVAEVVPAADNPNAYLLAKSGRPDSTQSASASPSTEASAGKANGTSAPAASSSKASSRPLAASGGESEATGQDQTQPFPPVLWAAVAVLAMAASAIVTIQMKKKGNH